MIISKGFKVYIFINKVLRHPLRIIPSYWSHHEKICIIDDKFGFIGGLDLCYGRYDTHDHPLFDEELDEDFDNLNEFDKKIELDK